MPSQRQNEIEQATSNAFLQRIFASRMKEDIDENDLLILLNESELSRTFDRHPAFNIDHCKLLISAISRSKNSLILAEFVKVVNLLHAWRNLFRRYDLDRNGIIESYALVNILNALSTETKNHRYFSSNSKECFSSTGFNLSPNTLETIVKRYSARIDESGSPKISFEHYIQLCSRLTLLNELIQQKSNNESARDVCSFSIDEFMQLALIM